MLPYDVKQSSESIAVKHCKIIMKAIIEVTNYVAEQILYIQIYEKIFKSKIIFEKVFLLILQSPHH